MNIRPVGRIHSYGTALRGGPTVYNALLRGRPSRSRKATVPAC